MAAAAAAPKPKGLGCMCCIKAAAATGSLKPGGKPCIEAAKAEAVEAVMPAKDDTGFAGGGEVTLFDVPLDADGVKIELTLKSEEGFGEVNTVVEVVDVVDEVSDVVDGPNVVGGGVFGGVVGDVEPSRVDDDTTVSSMSTGLCSWSRIIFGGFFFSDFFSSLLRKNKKKTLPSYT